MSITVLICVHSQNKTHDSFLEEALISLSNQTFKDFKIFIVLDECWSKTKRLVKSFSSNFSFLEINIFERAKKEGLALAKNYGLSFVDTDYVAFLDADDFYEPEKLEKQWNFLQKNDVDFLGTQAWNINISNRTVKTPSMFPSNSYNTHKEISETIWHHNPLTHGSMLIKMESLKKLNYYNNITGTEDWDLWQRAIKAGFKFHQLPDRLYVWCGGSSVPR